jgi:hypothetical protein
MDPELAVLCRSTLANRPSDSSAYSAFRVPARAEGLRQSSQCVTGIRLHLAALMRLQDTTRAGAPARALATVRVVITEIGL